MGRSRPGGRESMTKLPSRLHHTAYVTEDLEATRAFYEDVIGLPLSATW
ncbi:MAG TPA: VOC family protein, partial [Alteraurantiacibacter sp.]